jgi:hypothetical protein
MSVLQVRACKFKVNMINGFIISFNEFITRQDDGMSNLKMNVINAFDIHT